MVCFVRVIFHFAWVLFVNKNHVSWGMFRAVGLGTDVVWIVGMGVALWQARGTRKLRDRLGIALRRPAPR